MKSNEVLKILKISRVTGIARKVFPNAVQTLRDSGTAFVPIKISIGF